MPKGIIYLETMPVSADREAEYHKWYNDTHLAEICSVDGIVSARRFAPTDGNGPFIAIYELDCDDLDAVVQRAGGTRRQRQDVVAAVSQHGSAATDPQGVPGDRIVPKVTRSVGRAAHLCADGADEGRRRPAVQGHRHRRVHVRVLAVARSGGDRRRHGRLATR